jgi:hypothetical protein
MASSSSPHVPRRAGRTTQNTLCGWVRHRLAGLTRAARPADHLPWNKRAIDARQAIRAAVACLVLLAVNLMLIVVIAVSGCDLDWKHDRMGDMLWLLVGQARPQPGLAATLDHRQHRQM